MSTPVPVVRFTFTDLGSVAAVAAWSGDCMESVSHGGGCQVSSFGCSLPKILFGLERSRPFQLWLRGSASSPKIGESAQIPVKFRFALQDLNSSGVIMAQQCDICGKKPQAGNRISHAHNVTKRRWNVNLRPVHARVGAATKRMRVCTSCLRSGKVVKA